MVFLHTKTTSGKHRDILLVLLHTQSLSGDHRDILSVLLHTQSPSMDRRDILLVLLHTQFPSMDHIDILLVLLHTQSPSREHRDTFSTLLHTKKLIKGTRSYFLVFLHHTYILTLSHVHTKILSTKNKTTMRENYRYHSASSMGFARNNLVRVLQHERLSVAKAIHRFNLQYFSHPTIISAPFLTMIKKLQSHQTMCCNLLVVAMNGFDIIAFLLDVLCSALIHL